MSNGLLNLAVGLAMQVGSPGPSETPNYPPLSDAYGRYGFEGSSEQRYPFDSQQNWVHGYFQDIPAYGGHHVFKPYNYKDVLSQSQTAAGWGERPNMPYSQQFWHKYHDQATMLKTGQVAPTPTWAPRVSQRFIPATQPQWTSIPGSQVIIPSGAIQTPGQRIVQPTITLPAQDHTIITEETQGPPIQNLEYISPMSYQRPAQPARRR